ncbi:hypothetical protein A5696_26770 [Mycobacterium sp. E2699]|nr:hypothetical protein A5696_26770 [Mycobacterium sp. E2699]
MQHGQQPVEVAGTPRREEGVDGLALRGDFGRGTPGFRAEGAAAVAKLARGYAAPEREVRAATVNGAAGAVVYVDGRPTAVMAFLVRDGRVAAIDVLADPERIARLDLRGPRPAH